FSLPLPDALPISCLLHDAFIDRDVRQLCPNTCGHALLIARFPRPGDLADAVEDVRLELTQLGAEGVDAPDEHRSVPQEVAGLDVALGGFEVGLFDESLGAVSRAGWCGDPDVISPLDIPVPGLGACRGEADRDEIADLGGSDGGANRVAERLLISDVVVGGEASHHRTTIAALDEGRGQ